MNVDPEEFLQHPLILLDNNQRTSSLWAYIYPRKGKKYKKELYQSIREDGYGHQLRALQSHYQLSISSMVVLLPQSHATYLESRDSQQIRQVGSPACCSLIAHCLKLSFLVPAAFFGGLCTMADLSLLAGVAGSLWQMPSFQDIETLTTRNCPMSFPCGSKYPLSLFLPETL